MRQDCPIRVLQQGHAKCTGVGSACTPHKVAAALFEELCSESSASMVRPGDILKPAEAAQALESHLDLFEGDFCFLAETGSHLISALGFILKSAEAIGGRVQPLRVPRPNRSSALVRFRGSFPSPLPENPQISTSMVCHIHGGSWKRTPTNTKAPP